MLRAGSAVPAAPSGLGPSRSRLRPTQPPAPALCALGSPLCPRASLPLPGKSHKPGKPDSGNHTCPWAASRPRGRTRTAWARPSGPTHAPRRLPSWSGPLPDLPTLLCGSCPEPCTCNTSEPRKPRDGARFSRTPRLSPSPRGWPGPSSCHCRAQLPLAPPPKRSQSCPLCPLLPSRPLWHLMPGPSTTCKPLVTGLDPRPPTRWQLKAGVASALLPCGCPLHPVAQTPAAHPASGGRTPGPCPCSPAPS